MPDPIGNATFADVRRERLHTLYREFTRYGRAALATHWYDTDAMFAEIETLRARVRELENPSDAVCRAIVRRLGEVDEETHGSLEMWDVAHRLAIRDALRGGAR